MSSESRAYERNIEENEDGLERLLDPILHERVHLVVVHGELEALDLFENPLYSFAERLVHVC